MSSQTNPNARNPRQKLSNFLSEPMGDKKVTALPGIGKISEDRLMAARYEQASEVYDLYVRKGRDKKKFVNAMQKMHIRGQEAGKCFDALDEYY